MWSPFAAMPALIKYLVVIGGIVLLVVYLGADTATALILSGLLYFLPSIIASAREHHQAAAIFVLNLMLGWTGLGWIGALVWACTAVRSVEGPAITPLRPSGEEMMVVDNDAPEGGSGSFAIAILTVLGIMGGIWWLIVLFV